MVIVKKDTEVNPKIEEFVTSIVKTANCISRVAAEVSFQLPLGEVSKFKELFIGLDERSHEFKIASYGISITTLEEVFLKVAEGLDPTGKAGLKFSQKEEKDPIDDFDLNSVKIKSKFSLFFIHFWAIFIKRLQYFKRDKKGLCCEIFMPVAIVGIGLCITFIQFFYDPPSLIMSPAILKVPLKTPVQDNYRNSFYSSFNFPDNYYSFLSSNGIDNNNLESFDQYVFDQRKIDDRGLYGAYFLNSNPQGQNLLSYYAFVIFYKIL